MRTDASCVPRSITSWTARASMTASRSATPRWSKATATFTRVAPWGAQGRQRRRTHGRSPHVLMMASTSDASYNALQQRRRARDDVVDVVAEPFQHGGPRRGGAEAVER